MKLHRFLLIFLIAILYLAFALSQRSVFLPPLNLDAGLELESSFVDSLGQSIPPFGDQNPFSLVFSFIPPTTQVEQKPAFISLEYIRVFWVSGAYDEIVQNADKVCIDEVWVAETTPGANLSDENIYLYPKSFIGKKPAICFNAGLSLPHEIKETDVYQKSVYFYLLDEDGFWYPFDETEKNFVVALSYSIYKDGKIIYEGMTKPGMNFISSSNVDWDIDWSFLKPPKPLTWDMHNSKGDVLEYNYVTNVKFSRPLIIKILYPFLLFSVLVFIALLGASDSIDTFIQGSLAILFGIYSLRQLMIPSNLAIRTFLDICILGLYVVFSSVIILRVFQSFSFQTYFIKLIEQTNNKPLISLRLSEIKMPVIIKKIYTKLHKQFTRYKKKR